MNTEWPGPLIFAIACAVLAAAIYYLGPVFKLLFFGVGWQ